MTRERALELAWSTSFPGWRLHDYESLASAILAAVAEENEECAKIAEAAANDPGLDEAYPTSWWIANQIRARGIPLKVGT